jgi:formylglycine-generating enzyme required for sulfatase activity
VPKGLRAFDAHDADFFPELLPGPRDRDGLPESIRFWKTRVEEADADETFAVGLIYGPSGCGKSSLVKAGLLPRLSEHVAAVYVEATANDTEARLLRGLRKRCPQVPPNLALKETLIALRRGPALPPGKKVLIVLDQFEQYLHANKAGQNCELVQALRQCDGGRVQCIVLVRDDFWMAATRFMRGLEIRLLEGQNSAAVDLFPPRHAEKVLAAFGRAFAALPADGPCDKDQQEFLRQAVADLEQDGKVICVRLALFAEMMKARPWTPAALKEVGGTEGVGVTFLEETFSAAGAPPEHRYHQRAARAVLAALLPESGTDIKGRLRSRDELLATSGYARRPKDFDDLMRILDAEVRLITPTEPEEKEDATAVATSDPLVDPAPAGEPLAFQPDAEAVASVLLENPGGPPAEEVPPTSKTAGDQKADAKYYQLTHDYLVPALRAWLTRKQKETRRGRAELLLADRAAVWNARPENRQLPSLLQWLRIRLLTRKKTWTPPRRKMMAKAARYHIVRGVAVAVVLALIGWAGYEVFGTLKANALRDRLLSANTADVPAVVRDMAPYRRWLDPLLRDADNEAKTQHDARKQLYTSLALLPADSGRMDYLFDRLLDAQPDEVPVIRDALAPHKEELASRLWPVVEQPTKGKEAQRLRAAAALATYEPDNERWTNVNDAVANDLVSVQAVYVGQWLEAFRPVREKLLAPLSAVFRDRKVEGVTERTLAASVLADYAADQPQVLADLLMDADEKQFAILFPKFQTHGESGWVMLEEEVDRRPAVDADSESKERLAKRQANAAVALLRMNQTDKVWPLLAYDPSTNPDPRLRSYLIHRLGPLGADVETVVKRLEEEPDVSIRRALILSLGPDEFRADVWTPEGKKRLVEKLQDVYRADADPGLHAAAEWLLRRWNERAWLRETNEAWAKDKEEQHKRLEALKRELQQDKDKAKPQWYVNGQGQTMVVIPGPATLLMGSPADDTERNPNEFQHRKRIGRAFALASRPVTVDEYRSFDNGYRFIERYAPTGDCPVVDISWLQAAAYCNWLSDKEGLDKCYEDEKLGKPTGLKENYLKLNGYRLPTEAEWEYACRAGAATRRYYGDSVDLLDKYAWYVQNSGDRSGAVASKKPNDWGLFDMHGNVWCWCQERMKPYAKDGTPESVEDREDGSAVENNMARVLRGGSFSDRAANVRSATRYMDVPARRVGNIGFRPARTFAGE